MNPRCIRIHTARIDFREEILLLYFFVAMTDKLATRTRSLDKLLEALQLIHDRFPRLVTLLHGRDDNLIYPQEYSLPFVQKIDN